MKKKLSHISDDELCISTMRIMIFFISCFPTPSSFRLILLKFDIMEHIIHLSRLQQLATEVNIWGKKTAAFTVELPFLTREENERVTAKVNALYATCGCGQGRVAGIITLCCFILLLSTGIVSVAQWGILKTMAGYFGLSFVIMLITKIIMLFKARHQFHQLLQHLEQLSLNPPTLSHGTSL